MIFAKWLHAECRILLIDEPTRGVDVGAKREIYQLLRDLAARGVAIVMVSSELPEVLGMSDRIVVMREGRVSADALARPRRPRSGSWTTRPAMTPEQDR